MNSECTCIKTPFNSVDYLTHDIHIKRGYKNINVFILLLPRKCQKLISLIEI